MALADDLRELANLHDKELITSEEFKLAKAKLLGTITGADASSAATSLTTKEIADLDNAWEVERQKYIQRDAWGNPVQAHWLAIGAAATVVGGVMMLIAGINILSDWNRIPNEQGRLVCAVLIFATCTGGVAVIAYGAILFGKIGAYRRAEQEYIRKRERLAPVLPKVPDKA